MENSIEKGRGLVSNGFGNAAGGIYDFRFKNRLETVYFNDRACEMFGYTRSEYANLSSYDALSVVHSDDLELTKAKLHELVCGKSGEVDAVYRHICKNGGWRWVHFFGRVKRYDKEALFISAIQIDIDDDVRFRERIDLQQRRFDEQSEFLASLYSSISCGIVIYKYDGDVYKLYDLNDTAWKICGFDDRLQMLERIRLEGIAGVLVPDDRKTLMKSIASSLNTGLCEKLMLRIRRPDTSIRWVDCDVKVLSLSGIGKFVQIVFYDVTLQKQKDLERYCRTLSNVYDAVFEIHIPERICISRHSKNYAFHKPGMPFYVEEVTDKLCKMASDPDRNQQLVSFFDFSDSDRQYPDFFEFRFKNKDGADNWITFWIMKFDEENLVLCYRDVTSQKNLARLENENSDMAYLLREREKSARRSRLAMNISGLVTFDYNPETDVMKLYGKGSDGKPQTVTSENFSALIHKNNNIAAESKSDILNYLVLASQGSKVQSFEFKAKLFSYDFSVYRAELTSVTDKDGQVYSVTGVMVRNFGYGLSVNENELKKDAIPENAEEIETSYLYIIDEQTFEVLYCNGKFKSDMGTPEKGETCYSAFPKKKMPCENCPVKLLKKYNVPVPHKFTSGGKEYIMQASRCFYKGKAAIAVTGTDISCFVNTKERKKELSLERRLGEYKAVFGTIFDDIMLINFKAKKYKLLSTNMPDMRLNEWYHIGSDSRVWADKYVCDEDRNLFHSFFNINNIKKSISEGKMPQLSYRYVGNGAKRWRRVTIISFESDYYIGLCKDIDLERNMEKYRESYEKSDVERLDKRLLENTFEKIGCASFVWDYERKSLLLNEACSKYAISTYSVSDITSKALGSSLVASEDQKKAVEMFTKLRKGENHAQAVLKYKMADGSFRYTRVCFNTLRKADKTPEYCVGTLTDVDDEYKQKTELEALTARWNSIFSNVPVAVGAFRISENKVYPTFLNESGCRLFGYLTGEYEIKAANRENVIFDLHDGEISCFVDKLSKEKKVFFFEDYKLRRKSGEVFFSDMIVNAFKLENGDAEIYIVFNQK